MTASPVCFLDRDGVLIEERHYLGDPEGVVLLPGVPDALKRLKGLGYCLAVVSNQSGVARGFFSEDDLKKVDERLKNLLEKEGVRLDAMRYCPHHPSGTVEAYACECVCRKPEPGMLLSIAREFRADIAASVMIGDKVSDLEAGKRAGCRLSILVLTGHGKKESANLDPQYPKAATLADAVGMLTCHPS